MDANSCRGVWGSALVVLVAGVAAKPLAAQGSVLVAGSSTPEASIGVASDGIRFLVGIQGDASGLAATGARIVEASGQLGPVVTTGSSGGAPLVACAGTQFLLAWDDDSTWPADNVYGMFVQSDGSHGAAFPICVDAFAKYATGVADLGSEFLVVYARNNALFAKQVSPLTGVGPELTLTNSFYAGMSANNVASNGANYLVAWADDANRHMVKGRIVNLNGTLGPVFTIDASPAPSNDLIAVASNTMSGYLVAFPDEVGGAGSGEWDLLVRALDANGAPLGPARSVCSAPGWQFGPFLASDGDHYLVTWTDMRHDANKNWQCEAGEATCWDIWGCYLEADGTKLGAEWPIVERSDDQFASPVAFGAGRYLMAWTDGVLLNNGGDVYALLLPQQPVATSYCTAKTNTQGCTPRIAWAGAPSLVGPDPFTLRALDVLNNQNGIFFYGLNGSQNLPFMGGTMCVHIPIRRTPLQSSGGNPPPDDCSGAYAFDFNAWVRSGADPQLCISGQTVWGQFWSRDPQSPYHVGLTDAVEFVLGP